MPSRSKRTAAGVTASGRGRRRARSSARSPRRGRRARRRGSRPRRRGSGRSGPAVPSSSESPVRDRDDRVLLAEPLDDGPRRLEDRAEPGGRAGVLRQHLAPGVEDGPIRRWAADDRRAHGERDLVQRSPRRPRPSPGRGRRTCRRGTRSRSGAARPRPTSWASRRPRRSRPRGRVRRASRSASARNATALGSRGYVRKPPKRSPSRRAIAPASAAAASGVATPTRPSPVSHSTSTGSRERRAALGEPREQPLVVDAHGTSTRRASAASRSSFVAPTQVVRDQDVVDSRRRPSPPPRRASGR